MVKKNKLGLPFEYQKNPEFFDALNIGDDTESKNSVIEKLLKVHKVKTVLDMTCGTGSQVFYLIKHGYEVTGSDFSPDLLQQARAKAKKAGLNVTFIDGDIRNVKVGKFDAVITIFSAVSHLSKDGFPKAIRNIGKNLKEGGIYIFDVSNLEAMTNTVVADPWYVHKRNVDSQMCNVQFSIIDRDSGLVTNYDHCIIQKGKEKPTLSKSKFTSQIYTAEELDEILSANGFETISRYGLDGKSFVKDNTPNILTIARKH
ncbi:MAG TPA: class I SAM-dependent methyltransferase [Gammaproteobacteria bacterium]|nr:class I SAM-dependent methyltransferase [Gammaproteobacteria bacterium]